MTRQRHVQDILHRKRVPDHAIHVATALTTDLSMAVAKSNIGLDTRGTAVTESSPKGVHHPDKNIH